MTWESNVFHQVKVSNSELAKGTASCSFLVIVLDAMTCCWQKDKKLASPSRPLFSPSRCLPLDQHHSFHCKHAEAAHLAARAAAEAHHCCQCWPAHPRAARSAAQLPGPAGRHSGSGIAASRWQRCRQQQQQSWRVYADAQHACECTSRWKRAYPAIAASAATPAAAATAANDTISSTTVFEPQQRTWWKQQ